MVGEVTDVSMADASTEGNGGSSPDALDTGANVVQELSHISMDGTSTESMSLEGKYSKASRIVANADSNIMSTEG